MSYGLVYGLSAFGLSKQLRIEQTEAKQLMMEYFDRFGAVRDYLRASVEQARIDGYTETIFGRRRPPRPRRARTVLRENAERAALNAPSAYASNGWAVADGIKAGEDLHAFFAETVGKPNRTWGASLGGLITQALAECNPGVGRVTA